MQLLVIVLNRIDYLEELLVAFAKNGVKGATVLDSTGMAQAISASNEKRFLGSLRMLLDNERQENKTIFTVLEDDKVEDVKQVVHSVLGSFEAPNTGIMFTVPLSFVEGLYKKQQ